jgi:hypothetical protein
MVAADQPSADDVATGVWKLPDGPRSTQSGRR